MMNPSVYRTTRGALVILALTALVFSACSGKPGSPGALYGKMLNAYGGADGVDRITSFAGKGFIKKLPMIHVAESFPFDMYQNGLLIKTRMMAVEYGELVDVRIIISGRERSFQWSYLAGETGLPAWEQEIIKYRFPYVLKWIGESGLEGELIPDNEETGLYGLKYRSGNDIISIGIDDKTYLLREVTVTSAADSSFYSRDVYSDFMKVEGTWFPSRFSGYFDRKFYYEYFFVKIDLDAELPDESFAIVPEDTADIRKPDAALEPGDE